MKKILLALFLLSISSNALAKVEIWKCEHSNNSLFSFLSTEPFLYYKLDTKKLTVHYRAKGKWKLLWHSNEEGIKNITYDKKNDSLFVYWDLLKSKVIHKDGEVEESEYDWKVVYDFIEKKHLQYDFNKLVHQDECEVIE